MGNKTLAQLIDEAEAAGLWLVSCYQEVWFSPAELRQANAEGRFVWGVRNWVLGDPRTRLHQLECEVSDAERRLSQFQSRMEAASRGGVNA